MKKTFLAIFTVMTLFGTSCADAKTYVYEDDDFVYIYDDDDEDDDGDYYDDDDEYTYEDDEDDDDEYIYEDDEDVDDDSNQSSSEVSEFVQQVLNLVNIERRKAGVSPLKLSRYLNDAAAIRAEEITQVFSHTRPDGSSCFTVLDKNYYNVGENIAEGQSTPKEVMNSWMNSPGHRANILKPEFTELGVGYVYDGSSEYKHYWVQLFRRPR